MIKNNKLNFPILQPEIASSPPSFLYQVAADLIERFGTDLSRVVVVFPGRRARLFFNNYLYQYAKNPVWIPQYFTIDELFEESSGLHPADTIKLVTELYKIYIEIYNSESESISAETLDEFYFFGEILLNDFDDVDKNLVNAKSLFLNLQDLDELRDDFSHLSESQIEAITKYFKSNFQKETRLQEAFRSVWNILGKVYFAFKEKLKAEGVAYPGMLIRDVIENESIRMEDRQFVFVGFNVLNECEKSLFKQLKSQSLFYWDFDSYYMDIKKENGHEAGRYIRENIQRFGSALPLDEFSHFLAEEKQITIIASPSESGQSAYISPWIDTLKNSTQFVQPDTAIVLCNENILPTVMHAIPPEKVENVNITMGFPLTQSPVCSFIQVLTEMQVHGYVQSGKAFRYKYVLPVLRHPYTKALFPEADEVENTLISDNIFFPTLEVLRHPQLFKQTENTRELVDYLLEIVRMTGGIYKEVNEFSDPYTGLYQESVFRAYQVINRLTGLISNGELDVEKPTFLRLLKKLFASTSIPFHGEPVKGLQVMGVLETRTLDFNHIILLSTNEGFMPGTKSENTFIPQFLRKHFGLSTIEHQDSVYAYYFYRLLQRAKTITLVYNTDKTQTGKAEMSRFLLQLLTDKRLHINRYNLSTSIHSLQTDVIEVPKDERLLERIRNQYDLKTNPEAYTLSPSALNVFINCSLRFYLQYIEGIKAKDEMTDELDSSAFGTIFHRSAELIYREIGKIGDQKYFNPFVVQKEHFDLFLQKDSQWLNKIVSRAFSEKYFKNREVDPRQYNGEQLINFRVICHMLRRMIEFDRKQTPFYIYGLEYPVRSEYTLETNGITLQTGGIIDRLEEKDGVLRIVDYKTSGSAKTYKEMADLFEQKDTRASHIFQAFLYASILSGNEKNPYAVVPALLYLQDAGKEDYSPVIPYAKEEITDFRTINPEFEVLFIEKMKELFNPQIPFKQTEAMKNCQYCDFKELCNR